MAYDNEQLGWDSEITDNSQDFEPIPAGEYAFRVAKFERAQYDGGKKMGPCPMAKLDLEVEGGEYDGRHVFENLYLNRKSMWKLAAFFTCIGLRPADAPKDAPFRMDWSRVPGARGRMTVSVRSWKGNDERERTNNDVTAFLPPAAPAQAAPAQGTYAPPAGAVPAPPAIQQAVNQAFAQAQGAPASPTMTPGAF